MTLGVTSEQNARGACKSIARSSLDIIALVADMKASTTVSKLNPLRLFLSQDSLTKLVLLSLGCVSIGLVAAVTWQLVSRNMVYRLTLVAGNRDGESYILSKALEKVVEENQPHIQIDVMETGGTAENIKLIEEDKTDLATAQADVPAGPSARNVAVLYQDLFQLVVKENSQINEFVKLKGKRIGLPRSGGQYRSFLDIANHYGLQEKDFTFVGENEQQANNAFRQNRVDAVFRVRAPGNKTILELVQQHQGRILPIDQAAAMRIKFPAFEPATLPKGAYKGSNPTVPGRDLQTVGVQRLLLAHENVDTRIILEITSILDVHRQELADAIANEFTDVKPLVASINRPTTIGGTGIPIHPGAIAYYERDEPSFVQQNADYLALILTVALLLSSWLWQLKSWMQRRNKNEADQYIESAINLMNDSLGAVEFRQQLLDETFNTAAKALIQERISQESFRTFNEAYKTTRESIERERQLAEQAIKKQKQIVQQKQRDVSANYIKAAVELLADRQRSQDLILQELDQILETAATNLIDENISQESFRTFIEAYKTTRDAIERKSSV